MKRGFDVLRYCLDTNFDIRVAGQNIMKGCVGVNCPYCGDDPSYHLNIRQDGKFAYCVRCTTKRNKVFQILREIFFKNVDASYSDLQGVLQKYQFDAVPYAEEEIKVSERQNDFEVLWNSFVVLFRKGKEGVYEDYLKRRGISKKIVREVGIRGGVGDFAWRVMLPVRDANGFVVYFIGRHIGKSATLRYKNCPADLALVKASEQLFGYFEASQIPGNYVVLVEGAFDALRLIQLGVRCVAILRKKLSVGQIEKLYDLVTGDGVVYICLDADVPLFEAQNMMKLLPFSKVKRIQVDGSKDVGSLKKKDSVILAKMILQDVQKYKS